MFPTLPHNLKMKHPKVFPSLRACSSAQSPTIRSFKREILEASMLSSSHCISRPHSECANSVGFGIFPKFSELSVQCAKILLLWGGGGGYVYIFFEICEKRTFQKCMGWGGGVTFLSTELETRRCRGWSNTQGPTDYSKSESSPLLSLSTRAGTPLGHTSPCLWMGTYFFNFCQSCSLRAFTGTHPVLRGMAVGCELHISLFGQPDLAPCNGLTVP